MSQALIFLACVIFFIVLLKLFLNYIPHKDLPYRAKKYFFSKSEEEFFQKLYENLNQTKYYIFPKVRLADFIELSNPALKYQGWWNKIKSKHVDFLIWDMEIKTIAVAIELDGGSHNSYRMIDRDNFVDELYKTASIPLIHIKVESDFETEIKNIMKEIENNMV